MGSHVDAHQYTGGEWCHAANARVCHRDDNSMSDIPRRSMRVKVLYTFDDQNKSNCLARLPNAFDVPVVSLDENTQVGVIELKTCIQAIVSSSPELVAKLGHDYTVYAYDFSEYETPLVGQGMLSWILASASSTPNAPADESQTMVTGRVCQNMQGLFGKGLKETLEVKLKLVPVPTSMQHEYVENMERYHSLSQLMPEGFDYNAWSDFLKENPALSQLAQPMPTMPGHTSQRSSVGGFEPFHQMLTRNSPSQDPMRTDSFYDQSNLSFNTQPTRASSPAMSTLSFHHYQYNPDSRPASRASVRSDVIPPQHYQSQDQYMFEQQEEGPPKKRARIIQTKRPKKTPLTAHNDSLRVTASTAASVRLHRPLAANPAAALASADSIPRAPTPRPGDAAFGQRGSRRLPAPSALRHASMDQSQPYMSPYDPSMFSDTAVDSTDDERGESPGDTPMDMPSSPPLAPQRTASPDPSSPPLPTLPLPNDSGFVSDMPLGLEEDGMDFGSNIWDGSDLPVATETRIRRRQDRSGNPWQQVNPGPVDRLPQSYVPKPKQHYRKPLPQQIAQSIEQQPNGVSINGREHIQPTNQDSAASHSGPMESHSQESTQQKGDRRQLPNNTAHGNSPDATASHVSPVSEVDAHVYSRSATPNLPPQKAKASRGKGLSRSQTWSGTGEPMSDAPMPSDSANPRSGSGARRKKYIKEKMEQAIAAGELPPHCKNCGEIDTPTWRKAFTRVEEGTPNDIEISKDATGTGIIAYEVIEPSEENGGLLSYRVFKNKVTREELDGKKFEDLNLCNPCGLWLIKKGSMRPRKLWDKSDRGTKRKRQTTAARTKSISMDDGPASDAPVPHSEPIMPEESAGAIPTVDGSADPTMPPPPPSLGRATSCMSSINASELDKEAAEEALRRAIQSSPAGVRGSRHSPIDVDPDLTPKPTRRLLFPSPRKDGQAKSLSPHPRTVSDDGNRDVVPDRPRCQRCKKLHRACDRERPCNTCDNAGIGFDGCVPSAMPRTNWFETPVVQMANVEQENPDKENCPPPLAQEEDDLAHLFEDSASPKTTPQKDMTFQDLLKTPTPGSRRRNALTPRRGAENGDLLMTPSRITPSRNILTPRGTRAVTIAPETPFTRQLNAMLSDGGNFSSPSQALDFNNFPTFNTPGRQYADFMNDEFLSSDMGMQSSPPKNGTLGLGFELYEDPITSTTGLWNGASMFGSDSMLHSFDNDVKMELNNGQETAALLKMNVGGITMDFAAIIEEVVANNNGEQQDTETAISPEDQSQGLGQTPEMQLAE
ncbi:hypothetical protein HBH64_098870 [Parastagonospora nodorum]|nr:hypothetical protein HBH50_132870 [Parastagonospora nodorum]KAH4086956.1 hypothetical protein HBH48_142290 [Parastagonospora nodorum]KAH4090424.1 hypothetical protein HBH46_189740 [Parastagonospora nodorum]KAH4300187.1 hypothetical protein HBI01_109970 [Parastagonospora nodorum]KAH4318382.1 hypothetical protein HBI02_000190 [Parastagonospora nodorum]